MEFTSVTMLYAIGKINPERATGVHEILPFLDELARKYFFATVIGDNK